MKPEARQDQLLVQQVGDELVIYDQERHRAHRLNRTAALVWRYCDGQTTVEDMTRQLEREGEGDLPADPEVVWLALEGLSRARLLRERATRPAEVARVPRRDVIRRLGLAGALALALPIVTSIDMLTP
ncbi:MAG TPA: PqqD family protein, partial [Armatimonadaceae bacterium]|nr:PqqD family protein [Armatimonadaceae bacterium]